MFSTSPRTGSASFFVNDSDFIVSLSAVVWGVVIRTDEGVVGLSVVGLNKGCRWVMSEMCSSEVPDYCELGVPRGIADPPGGVSMTK